MYSIVKGNIQQFLCLVKFHMCTIGGPAHIQMTIKLFLHSFIAQHNMMYTFFYVVTIDLIFFKWGDIPRLWIIQLTQSKDLEPEPSPIII